MRSISTFSEFRVEMIWIELAIAFEGLECLVQGTLAVDGCYQVCIDYFKAFCYSLSP